MESNFISKRISKLCSEKNVSEREVSLSIGKNPSYINNITNQKVYPTMESFFDICDYFKITPFEFFNNKIDEPLKSKEIYQEAKRISNNNLDIFLKILKLIEPKDFYSYISILNKYKREKN